jgi:formate dehydrogenase alpha subunit
MAEAVTVTLTINGTHIFAETGETVLDAANRNGIPVPSLCHHRDLAPVGSCRLCMVEVEGFRTEAAACALKVAEGMVVRTETPRIAQTRKLVLEMLLSRYHDIAAEAEREPDDAVESEFMFWVRHYGVNGPAETGRKASFKVDCDPHPVIRVNLNKCILCTRCVRACTELQGRFVWGVAGRGEDSHIVAGSNATMLDARCESCGACAAFCPTGALSDRMAADTGKPDALVTTTCSYCGVGCNFDLNVKDGKIVRVTSNPYAPVNGMHLCVKGRYGYDYVHHADRLLRPRVRKYVLDGKSRKLGADRGAWVETDWDTALDLVAKKLVAVKRESSGTAIGLFASAKCTNEENYLMQKLARQVLQTHNVDHCARLCHSSTVAGLAMCFGSGAMSNTMRDVAEHAQALFVIGSNTTEQHPVFGSMLRQAARRRGAKIVIADPRAIDLTEFAALHVRQRPGTDVALINGLMKIIIDAGWHDRAFVESRTEGFDEFRAMLASYTPQRVAEITGVSESELHRCAEMLALNKPMAVVWAMGITQHTTGVQNVLSLGNLQMLLGNMGVAGGGVNPLRGQNNVQGACDMGALVNFFPGYQSVTDAAPRARFATAWALQTHDGKSAGPALGDKPGLTVTEMIDAAGAGALRALWILGENPTTTDPDSNHVKACLARAEFVVLQEIFPSDTSAYADVLLPGVSWAEKDGTFTNTERRIQLVREAIEPIGDARPDWTIVSELARRMLALQELKPAGAQAGWNYATPWQILDEIAAMTPQYAGVNHARLEHGDQLHWPVKDAGHPGTPILHVGQFTRGKGRFYACEHLPAQELPDEKYPLLLTTGRVLYHWHGGEMTRRSQGLFALYPRTLVEINPDDAAKCGVVNGAALRVLSRRGEMLAEALVTERVSPGVVFGNLHFPGASNVNNLTIAALDPIAKIPEYKVCAVRVEKVAETV